MPLLTTSYDVSSGDESTLAVRIAPTDTSGIKIAPMEINGGTEPIAATKGVLQIEESIDNTRKVEWISFNGVTVNADDSVTLTSTGVSRNVPRDGTAFTGDGTGQRFGKGAKVRLVTFHLLLNNKANIDTDNTFTGTNTFTGQIIASLGFIPPIYADAAARDAALPSPSFGMIVGQNDTGVLYQYIGGAWATFASGTTANASDTVAGKVERATTAQANAGTDTGETGAPTFVRPSEVTTVANLASTDNGKGASLVGVEDSAGNFAGTTVETVLSELKTNSIQLATLTAGATINGATLPVPVYQHTDGELYACDANDTDKMHFIGFAVSNSTDGNPIQFQGAGVVGGFTGLTVGAEYFVQDAAGTIGTTTGTFEILVGVAVSASQILITKKKRTYFGAIADQTFNTTANNDVTVSIGFKPRFIVLRYYLAATGWTGSASRYSKNAGIATFNGTTCVKCYSFGSLANSATDAVATPTSPLPVASIPAVTVTAGDETDITSTTILSTSDTGFIIRFVTTHATSETNSEAFAKVSYEAYE